jgi:hypothetical protein
MKKAHNKNWRFLSTPSKKAQMEIIGLVVIVILISLGILFLAKFSLQTKPQDAIFLRKELATSSLTALLKTSVEKGECPDDAEPSFTEVLIDCARHYPIGFGEVTLNCGGKHSCDFFSENAKNLLDETIGSWQRDYELKAELIRVPGADPELLLNPSGENGCSLGQDRDSSGAVPLPTIDAGLVEVVLLVCD